MLNISNMSGTDARIAHMDRLGDGDPNKSADQVLLEAGVTNLDLAHRWDALSTFSNATGPTEIALDTSVYGIGKNLRFLASLTQEELNEKVVAQAGNEYGLITYGELQRVMTVQVAMSVRLGTLMQNSSGKYLGATAPNASMTAGDYKIAEATQLQMAVNAFAPGAIQAALDYLSSNQPGEGGASPSTSSSDASARATYLRATGNQKAQNSDAAIALQLLNSVAESKQPDMWRGERSSDANKHVASAELVI